MTKTEQYRDSDQLEDSKNRKKVELSKDVEHRGRQIFLLAAAALTVLAGSIVFVGAAAGWFSSKEPTPLPVQKKATLSAEFINNSGIKEITKEEYQDLINEKKSFILRSHLPDCQAKIMQYTKDYATEYNIVINDIDWSAFRDIAKESDVKYAPTVIVISEGRIIEHLRSDKDADTAKYNDYNEFKKWLDSLIEH